MKCGRHCPGEGVGAVTEDERRKEIARLQRAVTEGHLSRVTGPPELCERAVGHSGDCGWFLNHDELESAIIEGRCGAQKR